MNGQSFKKLSNNFFSEITSIPEVLQKSYYPSLDGFRAIAIIMVVFKHIRLTDNYYYEVFFNGELGVLIFFVLSGFLITTLCLKEKVLTNTISLKNFYIRRALRILPVAYLYLITIIILNYFYKLEIPYISILGSALYLMNFTSFFRKYYSSFFTGHFWSLSVEEQFYLIIPAILKKNFKAFMLTILLILVVIPIVIVCQYYFVWPNNKIIFAFAHYLIKFQPIAIGCLFSVLTFKYSFKSEIFSKFKIYLNLLLIFLILVMKYNDDFNLRSNLTGFASTFLVAILIVTNIKQCDDFVFKFLNLKFMKLIGTLSYSIYIWQEIFTSKDPKLPHFIVAWPYNLFFAFVVSALSYYFYERYFLKLKSKFNLLNRN